MAKKRWVQKPSVCRSFLNRAERDRCDQGAPEGRAGWVVGASQFLDALLDGGPPVVGAPEGERVLGAAGHPHAEGVAGHLEQAAAHGLLVLAHAFAHDDEAPGFAPPVQLCGEAAHVVAAIDRAPDQLPAEHAGSVPTLPPTTYR